MGFSPYGNETRQFNIPPTAFSEWTVKYNVCLYFCLYGIAQNFDSEKYDEWNINEFFLKTDESTVGFIGLNTKSEW